MAKESVEVQRVLPRLGPGGLTAKEAHAILKVAFLAGEADGQIADEEETSFRALAVALRALVAAGDKSMTDAALDKMLASFGEVVDTKGRGEALGEIRFGLERPLAREVAYKVSVAMSLADLDKSDDESDFDADLMDALGITEEQAGILAGDVYAALEK
jgi:hypothetical protein